MTDSPLVRKATFSVTEFEAEAAKTKRDPFVLDLGAGVMIELMDMRDIPMAEIEDLRMRPDATTALLERMSDDGGAAMRRANLTPRVLDPIFKAYTQHYDLDMRRLNGFGSTDGTA